ncbi:hypothetical protein LSTR_LSTR005820, partial [Laodelphax striatellus]
TADADDDQDLTPWKSDYSSVEHFTDAEQAADIQFNLSHPFFTTDQGIMPGLVYQVRMRLSEDVRDYSVTESYGMGLLAHGAMTDWSSPKYFTFNWTSTASLGSKVNASFRIRYRLEGLITVFELHRSYPILEDCSLRLWPEEGSFSWINLPYQIASDCNVFFPKGIGAQDDFGPGLLVTLDRLNVPCASGSLLFKEKSGRRQRFCGKLEEIPVLGRQLYYQFGSNPMFRVEGRPIFVVNYKFVDYCYNVTLTGRNGSFEIGQNLLRSAGLHCNYRISLPYGYRANIGLSVGGSGNSLTDDGSLSVQTVRPDSPDPVCEGLLVRLWDGPTSWYHCAVPGDPPRQLTVLSRENRVTVRVTASSLVRLHLWYDTVAVAELVQQCDFGWVAVGRFCLTAVEDRKLGWTEAEQECQNRGGHLASIRSEHTQHLVDNLLTHSPGYGDENAYWVGATDKENEGDFRWSDGLPFTYSNWFPGWGRISRQPNDDGMSDQDCVEVRRAYHGHGSHVTNSPGTPSLPVLAQSFMWNDRDCKTPNHFLCQRFTIEGGGGVDEIDWECNKTVTLSNEQPRAVVTSPLFPRYYPNNVDCSTTITCPPTHRILIEFDELVLESESLCGYDVLELWEGKEKPSKRLCGDWTDRLKLLRHKSSDSSLRLRFHSDYSHNFGGYKARVSMEHASSECYDDRLQMFNNSCYLFAGYPEVTWQTAKQICEEMKADLASVNSPEEERFIVAKIRESRDYSTNAIYWLGGQMQGPDDWHWVDNSPMTYTAWLKKPAISSSPACLGMQWVSTPTPLLPSGLYWQAQDCSSIGGYVCKKENQVSGTGLNLNGTVNGTGGRLTSPRYPAPYFHNLDYWVNITGPEAHRIVIHFTRLDLEPQTHCLYDFLELSDGSNRNELSPPSTMCGHYDPPELERLNFVSESNTATLRFHSDYSISGGGYSLMWHAVDVSGCPLQTLTAKEGVITSPNYPHFLLAHLDCSTTILAPAGRRVWLEITDFDMSLPDALLELSLGGGTERIQPFMRKDLLSDGVFLSVGERLQIRLKTGDEPKGRGFRAVYKTVSSVREGRVLDLGNTTTGTLNWVNYPLNPPSQVDFTDRLVVPLGRLIHLQFYNTVPSLWDDLEGKKSCPDGMGEIEVKDNYADLSGNGTWWKLCEVPKNEEVAPLTITSYLNTIQIRQINSLMRSGSKGIKLNVSVSVQPDLNYKVKLLQGPTDSAVESCRPNPCQNGGKCASSSNKKSCQCIGHFTGMFCALTVCELEPCLHGRCELTATGFTCHCLPGYIGETCDTKKKPCADKPCEGRGECIPRSDTTFYCRCHAWWEGPRCERRLMMRIPYKPLSERMLQEPFWLGLITVTVVLGVLGLFWCAKRHFPEKLEKLLAEEADRNRQCMGAGRTPSVREQLAGGPLYTSSGQLVAGGAQGQAGGVQGQGAGTGPGGGPPARSLFGRLGIRKPSLLSLTSPLVPPAHTARTFSLDDLLKQPPGRTPSPRKKRNNSTPVKRNAAVEKKEILQQLVSPANRKPSVDEVIALATSKVQVEDCDDRGMETTFSSPGQSAADHAKLEKKVTFARLLDKVSSEMSSGSEMENGGGRPMCSSLITITTTTPPPDVKSPHSTSSNQGSDSLSSSDATLHMHSGELARRPARLILGPKKTNSADSILAMFRNFASTTAASGLGSSSLASPSTTPTASSPQDELVGSDDSSTATPISTSSAAESPTMFTRKHTIQVSVLDPLSAQKNASSSHSSNLLHPPCILLEVPNKCLSPIREVPTPSPSPALTPIMPRHQMGSPGPPTSSTHSPTPSTSSSSMHLLVPGQHPPKLARCAPVKSLAQPSDSDADIEISVSIPPFSERRSSSPATSTGLTIPTLMVQKPSPDRPQPPPPSFTLHPGSPPPHKEKPSQRSKFLKEFDKPTSLELPVPPPVITVTCSMSEAESDTESPANKGGPTTSGMCYLSPFSMCTRADRTTSESNLSSSGYSSMASPGPSRCGSNNPLCPSESDDAHHMARRPSPLIKTPGIGDRGGGPGGCRLRGRSDSETLSDDPQLESNDEGFGTDHLDEKIDEGELKSAKELEVFIGTEQMMDTNRTLIDISPPSPQTCIRHCRSIESDLENCKSLMLPLHKVKHCASVEAGLDCYRLSVPTTGKVRHCGSLGECLDKSKQCKVTLQLPSIVVDADPGGNETTHCSPVSSRSESPLSDKTAGLGRFSPMFYGRLTDSDGLYDCASSDCCKMAATSRRTSSGRRKERRRSKSPKNVGKEAPLQSQTLLDVPSKSHYDACRHGGSRQHAKPSPKRRSRTLQQPPPPPTSTSTTSSSSESLNSIREMNMCLTPDKSPDKSWQGLAKTDSGWTNECKNLPSNEASGEDTGEDVTGDQSAEQGFTCSGDSSQKSSRKISRIRTISHQIRFLRRLEQSLKRKEPEQSSVTTPLLMQSSSSAGRQQQGSGSSSSSSRLSRLTRNRATVSDEPLLPPEERSWKRVTITGSGHTD